MFTAYSLYKSLTVLWLTDNGMPVQFCSNNGTLLTVFLLKSCHASAYDFFMTVLHTIMPLLIWWMVYVAFLPQQFCDSGWSTGTFQKISVDEHTDEQQTFDLPLFLLCNDHSSCPCFCTSNLCEIIKFLSNRWCNLFANMCVHRGYAVKNTPPNDVLWTVCCLYDQ